MMLQGLAQGWRNYGLRRIQYSLRWYCHY